MSTGETRRQEFAPLPKHIEAACETLAAYMDEQCGPTVITIGSGKYTLQATRRLGVPDGRQILGFRVTGKIREGYYEQARPVYAASPPPAAGTGEERFIDPNWTSCDHCGEKYPDEEMENETLAGDAVCDTCAEIGRAEIKQSVEKLTAPQPPAQAEVDKGKRRASLCFDDGVVSINLEGYLQNGAGYFLFKDENLEWDEDSRIAKVSDTEFLAIRDWLNTVLPAAQDAPVAGEAVPECVALLMEARDFGQFSDDHNMPQALPIRRAIKGVCDLLHEQYYNTPPVSEAGNGAEIYYETIIEQKDSQISRLTAELAGLQNMYDQLDELWKEQCAELAAAKEEVERLRRLLDASRGWEAVKEMGLAQEKYNELQQRHTADTELIERLEILRSAVGNVLEGWTLQPDLRKYLETAYFKPEALAELEERNKG